MYHVILTNLESLDSQIAELKLSAGTSMRAFGSLTYMHIPF